MTALFFDTTNSIKLGLLDDGLSWISYESHPSKKASQAIHGLIHDLLEKNDLKLKDVKKIYKIAGPGSYTGMRVSEGMSQIFEWNQFKNISFYHYDISQILNPEEGIWAAKAFKNEYFIYEWDKDSCHNKIISYEEAKKLFSTSKKKIYSYEEDSLEELAIKCVSTSCLLKEKSAIILKGIDLIIEDRPLFYFRSIEEEFNRGK